jgi:hypothetical protein
MNDANAFERRLEHMLLELSAGSALPASPEMIANAVAARRVGRRNWLPHEGGATGRFIAMDMLWRMLPHARLLIAAVAIVAVASVGSDLAGRTGDGVSSPARTQAPSPSPSASRLPGLAFPRSGKLDPGFYPLARAGLQLRFFVPTSDWTSNGEFELDTDDGATLFFWTDAPEGINIDPCGHVRGPSIGPDAAKLVAALASIPGTELVAGPDQVTVGGFSAHRVVLKIPEDTDCSATDFRLWYARDLGDRYPSGLGHTITAWIIDVNGKLIWIDAEASPATSAGSTEAMQAIVDSIDVESLLPEGELEVGHFENPNTNHVFGVGASYRTGMIAFSVPTAGWVGDGASTIAKDGARITFRGAASNQCGPDLDCEYLPDRIYADPCAGRLGSNIGASTKDVATALTTIPGVDASGPSRVGVNLRSASLVTLTVREDVPCEAARFHLWFDESEGPRTVTALGDTLRVWIIDHQFGFRIWIEAETPKSASRELIQEIERIIYSNIDIGG